MRHFHPPIAWDCTQYITDTEGNPKAVIVSFTEWTALMERIQSLEPSQNDTDYLVSNPEMKKRLLQAKEHMSEPAKTWEEVRNSLDL